MSAYGGRRTSWCGVAKRVACLTALALLQAGCMGPGGRPDPIGTALLIGVVGAAAAASNPPPGHHHGHQQQPEAKAQQQQPQKQTQQTQKPKEQKTAPSGGDGEQKPPAR